MRLPNWEYNLVQMFHKYRDEPFGIGANDCCLFADKSVQICLGVSVLDELLGLWNSRNTMLATLTALGSLERAVTTVFGAPMPNPLFAMRGDIVLLGPRQLGVCSGSQAVAPSKHGLTSSDIDRGSVVWRVGHG